MLPSSWFDVQPCSDALRRLGSDSSVGISRRKLIVAFEEPVETLLFRRKVKIVKTSYVKRVSMF